MIFYIVLYVSINICIFVISLQVGWVSDIIVDACMVHDRRERLLSCSREHVSVESRPQARGKGGCVSLHRDGPCTLWTYASSRGLKMKKNPLFSVAEEEWLSGEEFFGKNRTSLVPKTHSLKKSIGNYR